MTTLELLDSLPGFATMAMLLLFILLFIFLFLGLLFMFELSWRLSRIQKAVKDISETNHQLADLMRRFPSRPSETAGDPSPKDSDPAS